MTAYSFSEATLTIDGKRYELQNVGHAFADALNHAEALTGPVFPIPARIYEAQCSVRLTPRDAARLRAMLLRRPLQIRRFSSPVLLARSFAGDRRAPAGVCFFGNARNH